MALRAGRIASRVLAGDVRVATVSEIAPDFGRLFERADDLARAGAAVCRPLRRARCAGWMRARSCA